MQTDPALLLFIIGALAGAAAMLLARSVPDIIFLLRFMAARRKARDRAERRYFLS